MVQYKAMEKADEAHEFRWQDKDKFIEEIARMDALLAELAKLQLDREPDGFRFSTNPFFLKFCPRIVFNPDDKGLFKGIYVPLDLWKLLASSGRLKGPTGGNVLSYENVGRRFNNSEFVALVANSWVRTTIGQSVALGGRYPCSAGKREDRDLRDQAESGGGRGGGDVNTSPEEIASETRAPSWGYGFKSPCASRARPKAAASASHGRTEGIRLKGRHCEIIAGMEGWRLRNPKARNRFGLASGDS